MRELVERWSGLVACTIGAGLLLSSGVTPVLAVIGLIVVGVGVVSSPLCPVLHTPLSRAQEEASPDDVIVFWKPGCSVCWTTLASLGSEGRAAVTWVNVWRDREAAEVVRQHQDGDLLTPTALRGDGDVLRGDDGERHDTTAVLRREGAS
ncbi:hypothetical protein [Euzebya tangerina]|uniref:hypothetical protein n=1 Tax=Euzebya tangerina TaxID=591198 RepID=UPI002F2DEA6B